MESIVLFICRSAADEGHFIGVPLKDSELERALLCSAIEMSRNRRTCITRIAQLTCRGCMSKRNTISSSLDSKNSLSIVIFLQVRSATKINSGILATTSDRLESDLAIDTGVERIVPFSHLCDTVRVALHGVGRRITAHGIFNSSHCFWSKERYSRGIGQ